MSEPANIKPLDVLLFRGRGPAATMIAATEQFVFGSSDWTHAGLAITSDVLDFKNAKPNRIYVLESTCSYLSGVPDVPSGRTRFGVQIRPLVDVLDQYRKEGGSVALCSLSENPVLDPIQRDMVRKVLSDFYQAHGKDRYETNPCICAKAFWSCFPCKSPNAYFCSELVVDLYQKLGLVKDQVDPETITPYELANMLSQKGLVRDPIRIGLE